MLWRWDYQSSDHQPLALICSIHDISYIKHCESLCACFKMHVYTIHNMYTYIYIYTCYYGETPLVVHQHNSILFALCTTIVVQEILGRKYP